MGAFNVPLVCCEASTSVQGSLVVHGVPHPLFPHVAKVAQSMVANVCCCVKGSVTQL